ncbi:B12-binding domain-containing radical SAM protein [candidate division CSSED10-310 bacterium]|uniref:B12-binding domain-containing radical SAM protein n=1 Tax=candidate division CSSED10-310 bacterium TaxID=2855610 RepID=A0ABV6YZQ9_UNCC1
MLLVNPTHAQWWSSPYLSIGYIASAIRQVGGEVDVIDCQIQDNFGDAIIKALGKHDRIGFYTNVATIRNCLALIREIRKEKPHTQIILGGPQATAIYPELIPDYADIIVLGEGEETIKEIVNEKPLAQIKGVAYWDKRLKVTPPRPIIADIDTIPMPAWDLIPLEKYKFAHLKPIITNMITHRGCPYQCTNCTKLIHGEKMRYRSLDKVLDEIRYLVLERGVREIHFWDDNFTFNPKRVKHFCNMILEENFPPLKFALLNGIRADIQNEDMFTLMRQTGFYWVSVAVESGVPRNIEFLKKKLDLTKVPAMVSMLKRLGYQTTLFFMLGLPTDTVDTIQQSIDYAKKLEADQIFWFMVQPFPGTEMHHYVEREGWFLQDMKMGYTSYDDGKAVYEMPQLKAWQMEKMFRKAYRSYYFSLRQLKRVLTKPAEDYSLESVKGLLRTGWRFMFKGSRI